MTTEEFQAIHAELIAIRKLLEARPPQTAGTTSTRPASQSSDSPEIPQPTSLVENPGDVQVHFGKNNGVPLGQLAERSLSFYASVKAPRLDNSGKPFPPRPQDVALENAARQLWHDKKGTLAGGGRAEQRPAPQQTGGGAGAALDEDVPFAPFEPICP